MSTKHKPAKFTCVRFGGTPAALATLELLGIHPSDLLDCHFAGDWGDLEVEDCKANDAALVTGDRILSSYDLPFTVKVWIITDAVDVEDGANPLIRETTTVLLSSDY